MHTPISWLLLLPLMLAGCATTTASRSQTAARATQPATPAPATQPAAVVPKPRIITAHEWGSTPLPIPHERRHTPRFITVHHAGVFWRSTGDPAKFVKNLQSWGQRDKNWPDLPYHFLIAPDGRIFEGRPLAYEPETNTRYPLQGHVGVELMGDFDRQRMTQAQLESVVSLVAWLCAQLDIDPSQIAGHKDRAVGQTSCPGKDGYRYLQGGDLREWVTTALRGSDPGATIGPPLEGGPTFFVGDPAGDPPATQPTTAPSTRPAG